MWPMWTMLNVIVAVFGLPALSLRFTADGAEVTATPVTPPEFPCKVVDGEYYYDLSELSLRDYWKVTDTHYEGITNIFYLSLCHPLRNVSNLCDVENDAGVCIVKATIGNDSGTTEEAIVRNAGKVSLTGPEMTAFGWLEYSYDNGQKCNHFGREYDYTTSIHFRCANHPDEETSGPVLMNNPRCSLVFAWITKAVCPKKLQISNPNTCRIKFSNCDHMLNLHMLHSAEYYYVSSANNKFEMNICDSVRGGYCPGGNTAVCDVSDSSNPVVLGTIENMELVWKDDILQLLYKHDSFTVEIQLFCERTASSPLISYHSKNATSLVFTVKTAVVCTPDVPECTVHDDDQDVRVEVSHCVWYDHCGSNYRGNLNCVYNGSAKPLSQKGIELLQTSCPEFVRDYIKNGILETCCNEKQVEDLHKSLLVMQVILEQCPACVRNLRMPFCYRTCSPHQSAFLEPVEFTPATFEDKEGEQSVEDIKFFISKTFVDNIYASCQDVRLSSTNDPAIGLFCGVWGASHCTGQRLFDYIGDKEINPYTPLNVQYIYVEDEGGSPEGTTPLNLTTAQPCDLDFKISQFFLETFKYFIHHGLPSLLSWIRL